MLHNPGASGGVSLRNDGENRPFRKVVYIFHIPPAKWCICDIYHLRQHRENGATSVYVYIILYKQASLLLFYVCYFYFCTATAIHSYTHHHHIYIPPPHATTTTPAVYSSCSTKVKIANIEQ